MITIWKYSLDVTKDGGTQEIEVPKIYQFVDVQFVSAPYGSSKLALWIMIDTEEPKEKITIELIATGVPIDVKNYRRKKIGTAQDYSAEGIIYIWHVFHREGELPESKDVNFFGEDFFDEFR